MNINELTFLPGLNNQLKFFLERTDIQNKSILIAGSNTERIARRFLKETKEVIIIVDEQEDLLNLRFNLQAEGEIPVRFMEYTNTDFIQKRFDIIYAQGSLTRSDRNKILKEFKKILLPEGIFCAGEIISITDNPPKYVQDLWNRSGLSPLTSNTIDKFYKDKGFDIIDSKDLSDTLKEFYSLGENLLNETSAELPNEELKSLKNILNRMEHEIHVYLKLGGDKHIGFKTLLLKIADK